MLNDDCVLWDFLCGNGISFVARAFALGSRGGCEQGVGTMLSV